MNQDEYLKTLWLPPRKKSVARELAEDIALLAGLVALVILGMCL